MATLRLTDLGGNNSETWEICVPNRADARIVLKGDLRATADRKWGDAILAEFDAGKNLITAPNGEGHSFQVEYFESEGDQ